MKEEITVIFFGECSGLNLGDEVTMNGKKGYVSGLNTHWAATSINIEDSLSDLNERIKALENFDDSLSQEEIVEFLADEGIDAENVKKRVRHIVKTGLEKRRRAKMKYWDCRHCAVDGFGERIERIEKTLERHGINNEYETRQRYGIEERLGRIESELEVHGVALKACDTLAARFKSFKSKALDSLIDAQTRICDLEKAIREFDDTDHEERITALEEDCANLIRAHVPTCPDHHREIHGKAKLHKLGERESMWIKFDWDNPNWPADKTLLTRSNGGRYMIYYHIGKIHGEQSRKELGDEFIVVDDIE